MKIQSVSKQHFNGFMMPPIAPVNNVPVAAIVRTVDSTKAFIETRRPTIPNIFKIELKIPKMKDFFRQKEAIVTDTKIRVVGLPAQSNTNKYGTSRLKLKGAGRKNPAKILAKR